jgi:hypothetical protein
MLLLRNERTVGFVKAPPSPTVLELMLIPGMGLAKGLVTNVQLPL